MRKLIGLLFITILVIGSFLPFAYPVQAHTQLIGATAYGSVPPGHVGQVVSYQRFTATASGDLANIKLYWVGSGSVKVGIYSSVADAPNTLLASNNAGVALNGTGWLNVPLTSTYSVVSGTVYWLATLQNSCDLVAERGTTGARLYIEAKAYAANLPAVAAGTYWANNTEFAMQGWTAAIVPVVSTSAASVIAVTTATLNGAVTDDGSENITYTGFVWDTSDIGDPGNVATDNASNGWVGRWKSALGNYGVNPFSHAIAGLTTGTTYYYRAAAYNSVGWEYGSAVSFETIGIPVGDTLAASAISSTTARLNGTITDWGNQLCDVQFVCDNVTNATWANFLADVGAAGHDVHLSTLVSDNYTTGDFPYADVTGLNNGQTYYFTDNITNDAGSVIGTVLTFITSSGISDCTNFIAVPSATTISYSWVKGTGGNMSLLRYSSAAYPPTIMDGTAGYLGTGNSVQITGLTPGTTYYASLWATTGGLYSSIAGVHALATTLAYDTTTGSSIDTPAANPQFLQTPDATKMANVPLLGGPTGLIQANSDAYGTPVNMLWYLFWMVTGAGAGIVIYNRTSYNLVATCAVDAIWFSVGAALGLTMMWIVVVFLVIAAGFTMFGNRH